MKRGRTTLLNWWYSLWLQWASRLQRTLRQRAQRYGLLLIVGVAVPVFLGCAQPSRLSVLLSDRGEDTSPVTVAQSGNEANSQIERLLAESWVAYRERFIQADGRVIDWEGDARTVSEGQAYAMLRALFIGDPETFEATLNWAESNLARSPTSTDADGQDHLWAWLWGERFDGSWGILDANFASDADIDAITALILAAEHWNRPDYLELALKKLDDLWTQSTLLSSSNRRRQLRYLLPGPLGAFQLQPQQIYVNPSYLAPYAFRLFADVDPNRDRDWMQLVDSSYAILEKTKELSRQGLPSDWAMLDLTTQRIYPVPTDVAHQSQYSFDAYRVWWRIAWDAAISGDAQARRFLTEHLPYFETRWNEQQRIAAVLDLSGTPLVDYEATSQYAMLYSGFRQIEPTLATEIRDQKLLTAYDDGIWDNSEAYYVQNLAWLSLVSPEDVRSIFRSVSR